MSDRQTRVAHENTGHQVTPPAGASEYYLKPAEYRGSWWAPDAPERALEGTLTFSPETGLELEFHGLSAEERLSRVAQKPVHRAAMLGRTEWGLPITLLDCWDYGTGVHANQALVGIELASADEPAFTSVAVHVPDLVAWATVGNLRVEDSRTAEGYRLVSATYTQPAPLSVLAAECRIEFPLGCVQSSSPGFVSLRETGSVRVRASEPMALSGWMTEYVNPLLAFLAFAAGTPMRLSGLEVFSPRVTHELDSGTNFERPLEVLFRPTADSQAVESTFFPNALFCLPDVKEEIGDLLGRWFAVRRDARLAIDYLMANRRGSPGFLEQRFLSALLGVESLHRATRKRRVDTAKHAVRVEAVLQAVSSACPQHRGWVNGRIKRPDEADLSQRLKQLLDDHESISALINDRSAFIASVVDTRTYLVHGLGLRRDRVLLGDRPRLLRTVTALELLLESELMRALTDSSSPLRSSIARTRRFAELESNPL